MQRIGLIGGLSWESTAEYYRLLNVGVRERLGGQHSADLVLRSVDFADFETLFAHDDWREVSDRLSLAAAELEGAGADLILLCTNTAHKVADQIQSAISVELIHIVDVVAARAATLGLDRLGLLGTGTTMTDPFYADRLRTHGVETIIPEAADRELIHRVIFDELVVGVLSPASRDSLGRIIARLVERGSQGIILGCTELELLLDQSDSQVPVLPTTRLHVAAALARALP